eukprot:1549712-Amphidinium_carterae.1
MLHSSCHAIACVVYFFGGTEAGEAPLHERSMLKDMTLQGNQPLSQCGLLCRSELSCLCNGMDMGCSSPPCLDNQNRAPLKSRSCPS